MDCLRCPRPRPLPVSVVNTITVAILKCLVASTLAQYTGYYGHNFIPYAYPYPYAYYPLRRPLVVPPLLDSQKASPPFEKILSHQIYLPPDVYRGYAYQTAYGDGGGTKVVFVRGPDANALLQQSIRTFSFSPVLPLSVTATSNVLKIAQNDTPKTDEKSKHTKTTEQKHKTASDDKTKAKTENKPTNKAAEVSITTIPPSHSTVTPGVFYYSLQPRPLPGYVNSLAPAVPYFQHPLYNPPFDFFGGLGLPPLFSAFDASAENIEISPNASNVPLFDTPGFFSESSGSNDTSSSSASVPNSSSDTASSQPTDIEAVSGSSSDNGASTDEDSSSSKEASTESNNSDESSSSETSSSSESNESSNSVEENASTSEAASDTEKSKDTGSASDGSGESSIDTSFANN